MTESRSVSSEPDTASRVLFLWNNTARNVSQLYGIRKPSYIGCMQDRTIVGIGVDKS